MMNSKLRVSLVIPVYNEESYLALCLDSIAAQTVKPFEVIVVDNNSSDQTVAIARRYPFVKVVHEPRQGVVFARDTGYNAAGGDIIGRLDGDSIIAKDWVETVQKIFANKAVDAVSGQVTYRDIGLPNVFDTVDRFIRRYLSQRMGALGEQFLYGVNMAIRKNVWHETRNHVCHYRHLHEDLDLAAHLAKLGKNVAFDADLQVNISPRQAGAGPHQFYQYVWSNQKVFIEHGMKSRRYVRRVALFVTSLYLPIHLMYMGYDPARQRFSLIYALGNDATPRPSPVTESV